MAVSGGIPRAGKKDVWLEKENTRRQVGADYRGPPEGDSACPGDRTDSPHCFSAADKIRMIKRILVIDVGGSNVKLMMSRKEKRKFKSGPRLTPRGMMAE